MSVKKAIPEFDGLYFITFTCTKWLSLFEITNSYYTVYNWFDHLTGKNHKIAAYVIMPNHVHAMIAFSNTKGKSLNTIIGNGKRFMAYEIIKLLKDNRNARLLNQLNFAVKPSDRSKGKIHNAFEPSFDWKECWSDHFIEQKVNYIHQNPCKGRWHLVEQPEQYVHSSARYYITGKQGFYPVTNWMELKDVDLTMNIASGRVPGFRRCPGSRRVPGGDSAKA